MCRYTKTRPLSQVPAPSKRLSLITKMIVRRRVIKDIGTSRRSEDIERRKDLALSRSVCALKEWLRSRCVDIFYGPGQPYRPRIAIDVDIFYGPGQPYRPRIVA